jgi:hypothetical protein
MKTITNPWKNPHYGTGRDYTVDDDPVFSYREHHVYKLPYQQSWIYTHNGIAFKELAGLNKQLLIDVADRTGSGFLYDRALETIERGQS